MFDRLKKVNANTSPRMLCSLNVDFSLSLHNWISLYFYFYFICHVRFWTCSNHLAASPSENSIILCQIFLVIATLHNILHPKRIVQWISWIFQNVYIGLFLRMTCSPSHRYYGGRLLQFMCFSNLMP